MRRFLSITILGLSLRSLAGAVPIVDITVNSGVGATTPNWTMGYSFTVLRTLQLNALGFYDTFGDGMSTDHSVGLWNSSGSLLRSATVTNASPLNGFFRYASVATLLLAPGTYTLGATTTNGADPVKFAGFITSLTSIPEISSDFQPLFTAGSALTLPTDDAIPGEPGFFGPNMDVTIPAPELDPTGASLPLFAGLALLYGAKRRRPKK